MKLTQKIFNEEMFAEIRSMVFSETISYEHILEAAIRDLRRQGYDVAEIDSEKMDKLVERFVTRLEKLSGYNWDE